MGSLTFSLKKLKNDVRDTIFGITFSHNSVCGVIGKSVFSYDLLTYPY